MQDIFSKEIQLENDRVILRPLIDSDIDFIEQISFTEGLREYGALVKSRYDLEKYFEYCLTERESKRLYPFIIYDKMNNYFAGITMFGNVDIRCKRLEIGWTWIASIFHGTGLNAESKNVPNRFNIRTGFVA